MADTNLTHTWQKVGGAHLETRHSLRPREERTENPHDTESVKSAVRIMRQFTTNSVNARANTTAGGAYQ